ncbi:MAG: hypothetical protein SFU91_02520 [Chloroherpetonaceae bacterium]|nr:hypothetical protein [Chloroherpetonaceae bacterium]
MMKSKKYLERLRRNRISFLQLFSLGRLAILSLMVSVNLYAQEVKFSIGGKSFQVSRLDANTFVAKKDSSVVVILPMDTLSRLVERVRILQERVKRDSIEIASQLKLIQNFEAYKAAADTNLIRQKSLIAVTDSISEAYKKLYIDLKSISGSSDYRLLIGGAGWRERDEVNLYGHFGFGYRDWQFMFTYGFTGFATNSLSIIKVFGF